VFDIVPLVQHVLDQALNDEGKANVPTNGTDCLVGKEVSSKICAAKEYLKELPLSHLNCDALRIEVSHAKARLSRLRAMAGED
jgi:hypothetical protein